VAPLRLGGLRGKQSTPSVGWEVPVIILGSASRNDTEREKRHGARGATWERGRHAERKRATVRLLIE
jgi:hypothetical protein